VSSPIYRLFIRPEAEVEIAEAAHWYETQERGLGHEFLRAVRAAGMRRNPSLYQTIIGEARRVLLRRFPYSIIYEVHGSHVVVLACFHSARDPQEWQARITRK
jgi:plasmid stabilization system protein ParE